MDTNCNCHGNGGTKQIVCQAETTSDEDKIITLLFDSINWVYEQSIPDSKGHSSSLRLQAGFLA